MKVDFQGHYLGLQRLIGARAQAAYRATELRNPESPQPTDFKAKLAHSQVPREQLSVTSPPALIGPLDKLEGQPDSVNQASTSTLGRVNTLTRGAGTLSVGAPPTPRILAVEKLEVDDIPLSSSATAALSSGVSREHEQVSRIPVAFAADKKKGELARLIKQTGMGHGVDPVLSLAVATAESSLNPAAVSKDGHYSKGLFQLLDRTGNQLHRELGGDSSTYDPFHPEQNVTLGVRYLRKLHAFFSEPTEITGVGTTVAAANSTSLEKLAVAAFNAGEGRVTSAQLRAARAGLDPSRYDQIERFLPETTRTYVSRVMQFKQEFGASSRPMSEIS